MKDKRKTANRAGRTLGQTILGGVLSIPMMETVLTKVMPFLNDGEWYAAGIAGTTAVLAFILSALQNWLDNHRSERRTSGTVED